MKNKIYGIAINFAKATVNNAKVLNNKISDCAVGIFLNHVSNAEVIENSIINTTALTNGGTGISATSCSNIYISNNIVTYTRQQGLYIKDCVSSNISKNTITDCGYQNNNYHCVDIHGTCSDLQIIGNTVIRNDTTLSPYSLVVNCNGSGTTNIQDTTVINSKLVLWSGSSNVNVSNTTGVTANLGTSNTITP
jgi:parallel beta-helix repeat protein